MSFSLNDNTYPAWLYAAGYDGYYIFEPPPIPDPPPIPEPPPMPDPPPMPLIPPPIELVCL